MNHKNTARFLALLGMTRPESLLKEPQLTTSQGMLENLPWKPRLPYSLLAILVLLAVLPYANTLLNGFVYDDDTQILKNPYIRDFSHLKAIFLTTVWSYAGGARGNTNYYRPVMTLGYLLSHKIFGYQPWGFHLVSLALNAAVVCLLFIVTLRIFQHRWLAFLAAALFALYPVHSEAVDWIAAVTELEVAFFFLLAFWFFLKLEDAGRRQPGLTQLGMVVSYALALLSKETAVTLPFLAAFYEHTCRDGRQATPWSTKLERYGALWLLLIVYLLFRVRVLGGFLPSSVSRTMPYDQVIFTAVALVGQYLEKLFWPVHLCAFYVFQNTLAELLPWIAVGCAVVVISAWLMLYFWQRDRKVCFAWVWFFVTLAPVLNARWMPNNVFAERYLYLPSAGFCWVVAWLAMRAWESLPRAAVAHRRGLQAAACIVAGLFIARVVMRNPAWRDDLTFYTQTLKASPQAGDMRNNLGMYYWDRSDLHDAGEQWEEALKTEPGATYILDNLGLLRIRQKRYGEAVIFFQRSLDLSPRDAGTHTGLGEAYQKMGLRQQAERQLRDAVALAPLDVRPRVHLGELYFDEGKYSPAKQEFLASIRDMPTLRGYFGLGLVDWVEKDYGGAERAFQTALRLDPADGRCYFMLGLLYGSTGRSAEAVREYQTGLKIDPTNKTALAALAKLKAKEKTQ